MLLYLLSGSFPELNESEYQWIYCKAICTLTGVAEKQRVSLKRAFPVDNPLVHVLALWSPTAHGSWPKDEEKSELLLYLLQAQVTERFLSRL